MKKEILTNTVKLTASEGHALTDGKNYCKTVYLASGDEGDGWYVITEEEYQAKLEEEERRSEL